MSAVSGEIINELAGLEALSGEWWDLWRRSRRAPPFLSPAWLLPWWRHFRPGELFAIAARQDGRLVGLAPGYIEAGPLGRRILPIGISLSDHLDVLADPDCQDEALGALVAAAVSASTSWNVWELEELLPEALALRLPLPPGYSETVAEQSPCPVFRVPEGTPRFESMLPLKKRRNLRLARNRCARRGEVRIERVAPTEAPEALEHLFRLHGARWEGRGEAGVLASDAVRAFQREAVPRLAESGMLRIHTLAINDVVVAVYYGLAHNGRAYLYLTGFDPAYDHESPGVVLMAHAMSEAVADGCSEIDFLRGSEPYKYQWGAVDRWNLKRSIRRVGHD